MKNQISVEAQMLIRKPVEQVFQAFIDPAITVHFWFTKSSGKTRNRKNSYLGMGNVWCKKYC